MHGLPFFKDKSAYVRKTAALGIAKVNAITPQLIDDHAFKLTLRDLIFDPNPNVCQLVPMLPFPFLG